MQQKRLHGWSIYIYIKHALCGKMHLNCIYGITPISRTRMSSGYTYHDSRSPYIHDWHRQCARLLRIYPSRASMLRMGRLRTTNHAIPFRRHAHTLEQSMYHRSVCRWSSRHLCTFVHNQLCFNCTSISHRASTIAASVAIQKWPPHHCSPPLRSMTKAASWWCPNE